MNLDSNPSGLQRQLEPPASRFLELQMPTTHRIPLHHISQHLVEELDILETARDEVVVQKLIG